MPIATYEELLAETVPQVVETEKQYREIGGRFGDLAGKGRARTANETKLMRLLALLIEDYDRRHALPPDDGASGTAAVPARPIRQNAGRFDSGFQPAQPRE